GRHVRRGTTLPRSDHLDVAPTVLALLGLPRAQDMPGHVLNAGVEALSSPALVATYETGARRTGPELTDEAADSEILARLKSLGYLDARDSSQAQRNVAERHFQARRYAEAARIYRELLAAEPRDAALRTSLAGALAGMQQYDAALQELTRALELDPLQAPAYHNRGAIYELLGRPRDAVREYRAALRYRPGYAPSVDALQRLAPEGEPPRPAAEQRAAALAEQARDVAQRGDFAGARRRLAEAERLAPRLALVYQYEANVAYLMNDRPAAIAALKKALALEPDNALFRSNLLALQEEAAARN